MLYARWVELANPAALVFHFDTSFGSMLQATAYCPMHSSAAFRSKGGSLTLMWLVGPDAGKLVAATISALAL